MTFESALRISKKTEAKKIMEEVATHKSNSFSVIASDQPKHANRTTGDTSEL